jgi:hypothetical protein
MAWRISVYCRRDCSAIDAALLDRGIRGDDPEAPAGVDYDTLAEGYGIDEALVEAAVASLRVTDALAVHWDADPERRPVSVHVRTGAHRVREEIEETIQERDPPAAAMPHLEACRGIVAIEIGAFETETMAIVIACEIARWVAQRYDGVLVDGDDGWYRVEEFAFRELAPE